MAVEPIDVGGGLAGPATVVGTDGADESESFETGTEATTSAEGGAETAVWVSTDLTAGPETRCGRSGTHSGKLTVSVAALVTHW